MVNSTNKREYVLRLANETDALNIKHQELNSWPKVLDFLLEFSDEPMSVALIWKVAHGKCNSPRVTQALANAGLIACPPTYEEVIVCDKCGKVHTQQRTCPSRKKKDARKTRAWHGDEVTADIIDQMVAASGHRSLSAMVEDMAVEWAAEHIW